MVDGKGGTEVGTEKDAEEDAEEEEDASHSTVSLLPLSWIFPLHIPLPFRLDVAVITTGGGRAVGPSPFENCK